MPSTVKGGSNLAWIPTAEQARVIDLLALGFSQKACERETGIQQQRISDWLHDLSYSESFREAVAERAAMFRENLKAIEEQQVLIATATMQQALTGEITTDEFGRAPLRYLSAAELLRSTRWKLLAGGHQKLS